MIRLKKKNTVILGMIRKWENKKKSIGFKRWHLDTTNKSNFLRDDP